jgi:hypothetical protein
MADDKLDPIPFPIDVTVNNVRVTVTLLLKPGTTVVQANAPARDSDVRSPETRSAPSDKGGQVGSVDPIQGMVEE